MVCISNNGYAPMAPMGYNPNAYGQGFMMGQQMAQMMQMMMGIMSMMGSGMPIMPMPGTMMGPGNPMAMGNYLGNQGAQPYSPVPWSSFPGSQYPAGPQYANGCMPMGPGGNTGSAAVDLGRQFLGQNSIDVRGRLPNFRAAGGQTNNCADFVCSCLQSTGGIQGHFVNVRGLEQALIRQGYHRVPASQAKPGDVWINPSRGHTELVATPGATQLLGSNNDRPGHQVISQKPNRNPEAGVYYSRG